MLLARRKYHCQVHKLNFPTLALHVETKLFPFQGSNLLRCEECYYHNPVDLEHGLMVIFWFSFLLFFFPVINIINIIALQLHIHVSRCQERDFSEMPNFTIAVITVSGNLVIGTDDVQHRSLFHPSFHHFSNTSCQCLYWLSLSPKSSFLF